MFPPESFSKTMCIRRIAAAGALSCHLPDSNMLLIQKSNFHREGTSGFRYIRAWISFEIPLYQENSYRRGLIVPPPRLSYAPDTKLEISERSSFSLSRYSRLNFFRYISVSGEQLEVAPYRATSSIVMCSWYKTRNFSEKQLLVF